MRVQAFMQMTSVKPECFVLQLSLKTRATDVVQFVQEIYEAILRNWTMNITYQPIHNV